MNKPSSFHAANSECREAITELLAAAWRRNSRHEQLYCGQREQLHEGMRGKLSLLQLLEEESTGGGGGAHKGGGGEAIPRLFRRNTEIDRGCRQRAAPQEWRIQGPNTERIYL